MRSPAQPRALRRPTTRGWRSRRSAPDGKGRLQLSGSTSASSPAPRGADNLTVPVRRGCGAGAAGMDHVHVGALEGPILLDADAVEARGEQHAADLVHPPVDVVRFDRDPTELRPV